MTAKELFDDWPERYDAWFATPIGHLIKEFEGRLVMEMLRPRGDDRILDAGCGTGVFTIDYLVAGAEVVGLDISQPMLDAAARKAAGYPFHAVCGDMVRLPFADESFDKAVSVTALEFIEDGAGAVAELLRVTKSGGLVVVGTLNSLSPWAARRQAKTERGQGHILADACYRSPAELLALTTVQGHAETVDHFQKDDPLEQALRVEEAGRAHHLETGAFVAARWVKPA